MMIILNTSKVMESIYIIIDQFDTIFNQELLVVNLFIQEFGRNSFVFLGGLHLRWLTG